MHTFPAATSGPKLQTHAASDLRGVGAIIARAIWRLAAGTALVLALGGCSSVRLAYNQAPNLAYWWLDGFVDLNDAQSAVLRDDLNGFFAWHRTEEIPLYVERLKQWQTLATQDLTPATACTQFEAVRSAYQRGIDRALPSLTRVALSLKAPQLDALARKHAKGNEEFEKEWLSGSPEERFQQRFDKASKRYADFYGRLSPAQTELLKNLRQRSGFDATRLQAERQRRQNDLVASLKQAQAQPSQAPNILRQWHERAMRSPDAAYAAYSAANVQDNCAQFAALHNTTSAEQRANAVKTLKGYETDLMALQRTD
ncbi:MAG: DUF6279 family lipoprotein, partial [Hydrogenophaga sp.]